MLDQIVSGVVVMLVANAIQSATKWTYQYFRRLISGTAA